MKKIKLFGRIRKATFELFKDEIISAVRPEINSMIYKYSQDEMVRTVRTHRQDFEIIDASYSLVFDSRDYQMMPPEIAFERAIHHAKRQISEHALKYVTINKDFILSPRNRDITLTLFLALPKDNFQDENNIYTGQAAHQKRSSNH